MRWTSWLVAGVISLAVVGLAGGYFFWSSAHAQPPRHARKPSANSTAKHATEGDDAKKKSKGPDGDEAAPAKEHSGAAGKTTTQPGSIIPDKSADLYAKVSGYLKELGVDQDGKPLDIGSRVKAGDVLAVIDVPELAREVDRDTAMLKRTRATVTQMKARIQTAHADFNAAEAMVTFRTQVFDRLDALAKDDVVDKRVVDEKEEQMHAAEETKNAAEAKILQAEADLEEAKAEVEVAQATLARAQVDLDYATIRSPYDGVITTRNYWPGDFVRDADHGASKPLLEVHKTDVVRVVVQIPDVDVPFVGPGNDVTVKVFNLPGKEFHGKVARIAHAEDPINRTMRVEIDLPNEKGHLHDGMYASVTISLENGEHSTVVAETETGDK